MDNFLREYNTDLLEMENFRDGKISLEEIE